MRRTTRAVLAGAPQLVAVVPATALLISAWNRIPDPMATRFTFDGTAVDELSRTSMLITNLALGIGLAVVFALVAAGAAAAGGRPGEPGTGAPRVSRTDPARLFGALSWGVAGFLATVLFVAVQANVDVADAAQARLPVPALLGALAVGLVVAAVGAVVTPPAPIRPVDPVAPRIAVGADERVSWSHRTISRAGQVMGALLVPAGLTVGWLAGPLPGAIMLLVGAALLLLGSAAVVTVDRRGLTVALGVLGWPRLHVPVDDVAGVTTGIVSPAQFGGWGYRIVPGGSGVILRAGAALIVTRRSGRRFTVTVDDAETAAGLLDGLAHRPA